MKNLIQATNEHLMQRGRYSLMVDDKVLLKLDIPKYYTSLKALRYARQYVARYQSKPTCMVGCWDSIKQTCVG